MKIHHLLLLGFVLIGAPGCPTRDKYDRMPTVQITTPTAETYTNGVVHIEVSLNPDLDLPITLRRSDGVDLAVLPPPLRSYDWSTTTFPEGTYTITAEVTFSNGPARSAPVTIVVDRQPPIIALTPAHGAVDVTLRAPIRAVFSEPVVLPAPASAVFSLTAGALTVPTTATLGTDGRSVTIAIDDYFQVSPPAVLAISIDGTITDRAGNAFSTPFYWSWSVPDWLVLPATFGSAIQPVLTLGTDDLPVIGYARSGSMGVNAVAVARYDGEEWSQLSLVSGFGDAAAAGVSVATDSHNSIFVAWSDYGTGSRFINVRRWDGANWDQAIPVLDAIAGTGTDAVAPQIRFDRADRLVVSWIENGDIFLARWSGSAWERPWDNLGLSEAMANELNLDLEGNPIIAWRMRVSDQGISVWNGMWTTTALPGSSQPPTVALDSAQAPITAQVVFDTITVLRVANRQTFAATNALVGDVGDQNARLMADAQGNPAVVWLNTAWKRLRFARWTGTTWNKRAGSFDDGTGSLEDTTAPQVVADSTGTAWIAWRESNLVHVRMTNH